ncbi:MAG: SDR family oxidoreductase [Alphaproteobacteria bacterium]
MTRILVTGATGFIGTALCRDLKARGFEVSGTVRATGPEHHDQFDPVAVGEIGPDTDWSQILGGIDAIVHLAGRAHDMGQARTRQGLEILNLFRWVNVQATKNLAEAAIAHEVRRFIYMSSIKVLGEHSAAAATGPRPFTDDDRAAPQDAHGTSKWEAECTLREIAAGSAMEPVILRPPLVYGPGVKGNFLSLMRICDGPWPLPLALVDNRRSLIYVGNLTDAVIACLSHDAAANQTFLVRDGEDMSTAELTRRLRQGLGQARRLVPVPPLMLRLAGYVCRRRAETDRLTGSLVADDGRIRGELGWSPPFSFDDGLERTISWYQTQSSRP